MEAPDYKSRCAVWGPFLKSSAPVLCLMTAPALALGTHSCWEPFWSKSFIGSEGEVTYFNTTEAQPWRAKQDQVYVRLVVEWQKEKRERLSTFTAGRRLCVLFLLITLILCLPSALSSFKFWLIEQVKLQRKVFNVGGKLECKHTDSLWFLFGNLTNYLSLHKTKWLLTDYRKDGFTSTSKTYKFVSSASNLRR